MKRSVIHKFILLLLVIIVLSVISMLLYLGFDYYATSIDERYFHEQNQWLKSSGLLGHGFGIIGSLMIVFGVFSYMARKRYKWLSRIGLLKYWLEMHIFFCVLGPVLILFHTSFKFGGIVAVSFWSMLIVVLSGVIGRFIYLQIPRTIEGREMNRMEINEMKLEMNQQIHRYIEPGNRVLELFNDTSFESTSGILGFVLKSKSERKAFKALKTGLRKENLPRPNEKVIIRLYKKHNVLGKRIDRLMLMQNLFKYWHVAHLPFALIMLVIMIIHIVVVLTFGYKWIF